MTTNDDLDELRARDPDMGARTDADPHAHRVDRYATPKVRKGWLQNRRDKVRAEIERNRRGEYKVPTWVLAATLVVFLIGWVLLIAYA